MPKTYTLIKLVSIAILILPYSHQSHSMENKETTLENNKENEIMSEFCTQLFERNKGIELDGRDLMISYQSKRSIDLSSKTIHTLAPQICSLDKLGKLYLLNNQITTLPIEMGCLKNLVILNLRNNHLNAVPKVILNLNKLKELYLHENQIESIPPKIDNLIELEILYLSKNKLESVPPRLGKLKLLKVLDLSNNDLKFIPLELSYIRNLTKLNLCNNSGLGLRWGCVFSPYGLAGDQSLQLFQLLCKTEIITQKYLVFGSLSSPNDGENIKMPVPKEIISLIFKYLWQVEKIPNLDQNSLSEFTP